MFPSLLLFAAAPLAAQTQTVPPPVVASDPVPTPTPDASPTPAADPSPAASPTRAATPTPSPAANPESGRAPIAPPSPAPTPDPDPTPEATPTSEAIAPLPDASPTPETIPDLPGAVTTTVADDARTGDGGGGWLLWAGIAFVVLAAVIVGRLLLPRRRSRVIEEEEEVRAADPPVAPLAASPRPRPAPTAATPAPASAAPTIDFRPARIGLNLVSVTATGDILVRNGADAAMHDIRVRASLLAAAAGHEAAVADLHRQPAGRLAVPSFALDPGETRAIRLTVAAPRSAIEPLSVGGRPMMVPLIAVTVDWRDAVGGRRRTQAFAVGVERVDSAKLAPVWLDQDSRNFDAVAARPHGMVLD